MVLQKEQAIKAAIHGSIPVKTRSQTNWIVKVWTQWAVDMKLQLEDSEN